jgi:hypothetical protein
MYIANCCWAASFLYIYKKKKEKPIKEMLNGRVSAATRANSLCAPDSTG